MTLSIAMLYQYNDSHYADCRISFIAMLNVIILSVILLFVIMLGVVVLNVVMLCHSAEYLGMTEPRAL
jgi:hypothetical protein